MVEVALLHQRRHLERPRPLVHRRCIIRQRLWLIRLAVPFHHLVIRLPAHRQRQRALVLFAPRRRLFLPLEAHQRSHLVNPHLLCVRKVHLEPALPSLNNQKLRLAQVIPPAERLVALRRPPPPELLRQVARLRLR